MSVFDKLLEMAQEWRVQEYHVHNEMGIFNDKNLGWQEAMRHCAADLEFFAFSNEKRMREISMNQIKEMKKNG